MSVATTQGMDAHNPAPDAHSADKNKTSTIIINATPHEVSDKEISYEQVVNLAYDNTPPAGENVVITVTYSRGEHGQEGSMLPEDKVKLKSKMVFDVSATNRS
jgi:hypothetical protein